MKTLKLTLAVLMMLVVSAPVFAMCGYCVTDGSGFTTCDGTPGTPCRVIFHVDYTECYENQGFCRRTAAPEAVTEQWTVASVETNGVVTTADVPQARTAQLDRTSVHTDHR